MAKIHYLIAIFLIFLFSSCKSEQSKILSQADSVMESRPDSAMTLLESIDRSRLTQSELPYYALLYTQAQVKTDVPLDSDSLISIAFAKYGDTPKDDRGLRANFYTGEVLFNRQKNPQAMRYFLTVYEESKRLGNNYWRAKAAERISDLFYFAYNYDEAEKYAQEAAQLFKLVGRQTFHLYTLAALANIYINNGYNEKAYHLLDSLKNIVINVNPVDSSLLEYMNIPMMSAMLNTGRANEIDFDNIESDDNKTDGELVDDAILQSQLLDSIGEADKATGILSDVQLLAHTDEDKVHLLYAQYENARSVGDNSLALSLVDSLLFYQNKVAVDIIGESVVGAQRDFYSVRALHQEERNSFLRYLIFTIVISFLIVLVLVSIIIFQKYKAYKTKSDSDLEAIMSLRSESKNLALEKNKLHNSLNEKGKIINDLNKKIESSKAKVEALNAEIESKDSEFGRLQGLMKEKNLESEKFQELLIQKDNEYQHIQTLLDQKMKKEMADTRIIEILFREKWHTLDRLCTEYFSLNQSEISAKALLENIKKEVDNVTSENGIQEIVSAVDTYMGGIITLLKNECSFLKDSDINYIALVYAGFTVKAVCLFLNIKYQNFFVKKSRLIKRIKNSEAIHKDLFISKFK